VKKCLAFIEWWDRWGIKHVDFFTNWLHKILKLRDIAQIIEKDNSDWCFY
jgi:hypothetical protein